MPIYEPGLEGMVKRNVKEERISFSSDVDSAISRSELVFICVGTPPKEGGETDCQGQSKNVPEGQGKNVPPRLKDNC